MAVLREAKARHLGQPLAATTLRRWDVAFYTERVRKERFNVDAAQFHPCFPPEANLAQDRQAVGGAVC
jgi:thimet oligopeptidase